MASAQMDALRAEVEATRGVMQSSSALIAGLHARLTEAGTDAAALDAIKTDLATERESLAAAIAANPL